MLCCHINIFVVNVLSHSVVSDFLRPSGLKTARLLCPWGSPGKDTGRDCYALLQGIFPTQGSNIGLPHFRHILYCLSHQGSPLSRIFPLYSSVSLVAQTVKNPPCSVGDLGSIPELGRSPGGGHGNSPQYSCLENPMDREAWQATVHGVTKESDILHE